MATAPSQSRENTAEGRAWRDLDVSDQGLCRGAQEGYDMIGIRRFNGLEECNEGSDRSAALFPRVSHGDSGRPSDRWVPRARSRPAPSPQGSASGRRSPSPTVGERARAKLAEKNSPKCSPKRGVISLDTQYGNHRQMIQYAKTHQGSLLAILPVSVQRAAMFHLCRAMLSE